MMFLNFNKQKDSALLSIDFNQEVEKLQKEYARRSAFAAYLKALRLKEESKIEDVEDDDEQESSGIRLPIVKDDQQSSKLEISPDTQPLTLGKRTILDTPTNNDSGKKRQKIHDRSASREQNYLSMGGFASMPASL